MTDPLERIAREVLGLETLREQKSNRLDFPEIAVWKLRAALQAAYREGAKAARGNKNAPGAGGTSGAEEGTAPQL